MILDISIHTEAHEGVVMQLRIPTVEVNAAEILSRKLLQSLEQDTYQQ